MPSRSRRFPRPFPAALLPVLLAVVLGPAAPAAAAPGDTTWVHTFDQEFINWATPHYGTFAFPEHPESYSSITAFLTIGCPAAPGDCDPWDRLGNVRVVTPDQGDVEIARFVTPYDITGGDYPGTCAWTHDMTNYKSLLRGDVDLRLYIESWIGGNRGWLITLDFAFVEGELALEPYKVVNLWTDDWVEYGNPDDPLESYIQPMQVDVPGDAEAVQVRVYTTGHGQGNTENCAEFCPKIHDLQVEQTVYSHTLWRQNCWNNACSPQGGTWSLARAGWCPGARATPWILDVSDAVVPGQPNTFDYRVAAYENLCRPGNPGCVSGSTCPDCNYNSTGHTVPIYVIQSQAIFFTSRANVVGVEPAAGVRAPGFALGRNVPNPFEPATTFDYTIPRPATAEIRVVDLSGRTVYEELRHHSTPGTFSVTWDGRDAQGRPVAAGVYFYTVSADGATRSRKMIRLR